MRIHELVLQVSFCPLVIWGKSLSPVDYDELFGRMARSTKVAVNALEHLISHHPETVARRPLDIANHTLSKKAPVEDPISSNQSQVTSRQSKARLDNDAPHVDDSGDAQDPEDSEYSDDWNDDDIEDAPLEDWLPSFLEVGTQDFDPVSTEATNQVCTCDSVPKCRCRRRCKCHDAGPGIVEFPDDHEDKEDEDGDEDGDGNGDRDEVARPKINVAKWEKSQYPLALSNAPAAGLEDSATSFLEKNEYPRVHTYWDSKDELLLVQEIKCLCEKQWSCDCTVNCECTSKKDDCPPIYMEMTDAPEPKPTRYMQDNSNADHVYSVDHQLGTNPDSGGVYPSQAVMWFSPIGRENQIAYPLLFSLDKNVNGNPVNIQYSRFKVKAHITKAVNLHGIFEAKGGHSVLNAYKNGNWKIDGTLVPLMFDSGWQEFDIKLVEGSMGVFQYGHGLKTMPTYVEIHFSPEKCEMQKGEGCDAIYPLVWRGDVARGNPVCIEVTSNSVKLHLFRGGDPSEPLHSVWDAESRLWTPYYKGYFRIQATKMLPQYDSGWVIDSVQPFNHKLNFCHHLGEIPKKVMLYYSDTKMAKEKAVLVTWNKFTPYINPVTISCDRFHCTIDKYAGLALHAFWDGKTGKHTVSMAGWWRLIAWTKWE